MTRLALNFPAAPRGDPITHNRCTALIRAGFLIIFFCTGWVTGCLLLHHDQVQAVQKNRNPGTELLTRVGLGPELNLAENSRSGRFFCFYFCTDE